MIPKIFLIVKIDILRRAKKCNNLFLLDTDVIKECYRLLEDKNTTRSEQRTMLSRQMLLQKKGNVNKSKPEQGKSTMVKEYPLISQRLKEETLDRFVLRVFTLNVSG